MLCLVPRDPTHLAACRRWPALCRVSARCGIDTTLLCVCAGRRLSLAQSLRGNRFSKSRTPLLDNPTHGDSDDDVTFQTDVPLAEYNVIKTVQKESVMGAIFWHLA